VTNDLQRRLDEHRAGHGSRFTSKYKVNRLLYYEQYKRIKNAIAREKQIKSWPRKRKNELIKQFNPKWWIYISNTEGLIALLSGTGSPVILPEIATPPCGRLAMTACVGWGGVR